MYDDKKAQKPETRITKKKQLKKDCVVKYILW